jgi:methyl-accepting chemotaxis protein
MKLKTKVMAMNSLILLFVGTMMFLQFRSAQNKQKYEIRKGFAQTSEKLQRSVSGVFNLYYHNVQNIALNKTLQSTGFDDINFYFNELVSLYPLYDAIIFVDKSGKYIASNSLDRQGQKLDINKIKTASLNSTKWFEAVSGGKFIEDYEKKIYGSFFGEFENNKLLSDLYGKETHGTYIATAVNDEYGDLIGFVATFVNGKWVTDELVAANTALEKEGKKGAKIWITNNEGLVLSEIKASKLTEENFLSLNIINKYNKQIEKTKELLEPGFFSAMFAIDSTPLYAYSHFSNSKFVDSIGWSVFVEMASDNAFSSISVASNIFTISFFVILLLGTFTAVLFSNKLSNDLLTIASNIADGSINISDAARQLTTHSNNLSMATGEQASSLQETVASLYEISQMIDKNTDASQSSKDLSGKSRNAAKMGKGTIENMITSIDEIGDANSEIIKQMNQNTEEIQEIITIIREIEDKTKVINDIVFQTKLLSFNASVEAARAGEHGKGFSVVAEEVGNLAQHSGNAAREIEEMLTKSVVKVESIAKNTEKKVEQLIKLGVEKVEQGKNVAKQCDGALGEILDNANNLDSMIEEIATASVEQSQGVQEISNAMGELDKVTKQNSIIAYETNQNTESLNNQATGLKTISIKLTDLITGNQEAVDDSNVINFSKTEPETSLEEEPLQTKKYVVNSGTSVPDASEFEDE